MWSSDKSYVIFFGKFCTAFKILVHSNCRSVTLNEYLVYFGDAGFMGLNDTDFIRTI